MKLLSHLPLQILHDSAIASQITPLTKLKPFAMIWKIKLFIYHMRKQHQYHIAIAQPSKQNFDHQIQSLKIVHQSLYSYLFWNSSHWFCTHFPIVDLSRTVDPIVLFCFRFRVRKCISTHTLTDI